MTAPLDVLVVGGGPGGLAAAIRIKQQLVAASAEATVAVIDKAPRPGYHALSGASFEPAPLDELVPAWRDDRKLMEHMIPVERDEMYFLLGKRAIKMPGLLVPKPMDHHGDVTISLSRLVGFLATKAEGLGVELYNGFAARQLLVEGGRVTGVALGAVGESVHGGAKANQRPAEEIRARVTILADGTHGVISNQLRDQFGAGKNPQVYSLGIKAVVSFAGDNPYGNHRVMHTLGYPNPQDVFGGGFLYSMGEKTVAVGLILGLDWKYGDLNPQREFERYRAHPFIAGLLAGGVTIATGAKTIPEGPTPSSKGWPRRTGACRSAATSTASRRAASCPTCATPATTGRPSGAGSTSARRSRSSRAGSRSGWGWSPTSRGRRRAPAWAARIRAAWTGRRSSASPARSTARTSRPT